jgi:O-antigen/teichoic acid export membrane protein
MLKRIFESKYFLSISDQCLVSFVNFFTITAMARFLTLKNYSEFYIVYLAIIMVNNSFQVTFIKQPICIFAQTIKKSKNREIYYSSGFQNQIIVSSISAIFLIIILWYNDTVNNFTYSIIVFAIFPIQLQEYYRNIFFTEIEPKKVLYNDLLTYGSRAIFFLILLIFSINDNFMYYIAIGVSSILGSSMGIIQTKIPKKTDGLLTTFKNNFNFGKWLFADSFFDTLSQRGFIVIIAKYISVERFGTFAACSTLLNVFNIVLIGLINIVTPLGMKKFVEHKQDFRRFFIRLLFWGSLFILLVGLLFFYNQEFIMKLVYGEKFGNYSLIVGLLIIGKLITYFTSIFALVIKYTNNTKVMFYSRIVAAIFCLSAGVFISRTYQAEGIAFSITIAHLISLCIIIWFLSRIFNNLKSCKTSESLIKN